MEANARRTLRLAAPGALLALVCLVAAALRPELGLRAWLAGAFVWTAVPVGAIGLLMMIRLIPGVWAAELAGPMEALSALLPLAALAFLPILAGAGALYPWAGAPGDGAFRQVYLTHWFFALRSVVFFAALIVLALLVAVRRSRSVPVASAGLIVYTLLGMPIAVDWLLSLDPAFHSSGFGLYVMSIEMTAALAAGIAMAVGSGAPIERPGVLGGLLLTALLFWAYLAFMQYVITWSDNLPAGAAWYQRRGVGSWSAVEYLIGVLGLGPFVLLLSPDVRRGRTWLFALAVAVFLGNTLEAAWLVLPGAPAPGWALSLLTLAALAGLGLLFGAALMALSGYRAQGPAPSQA
jgi:hypothetical protein